VAVGCFPPMEVSAIFGAVRVGKSLLALSSHSFVRSITSCGGAGFVRLLRNGRNALVGTFTRGRFFDDSKDAGFRSSSFSVSSPPSKISIVQGLQQRSPRRRSCCCRRLASAATTAASAGVIHCVKQPSPPSLYPLDTVAKGCCRFWAAVRFAIPLLPPNACPVPPNAGVRVRPPSRVKHEAINAACSSRISSMSL
jgi:hypothetical protein